MATIADLREYLREYLNTKATIAVLAGFLAIAVIGIVVFARSSTTEVTPEKQAVESQRAHQLMQQQEAKQPSRNARVQRNTPQRSLR